MTYLVIQEDGPNYGYVISRHRTEVAAQVAVARELARLRRVPGQQNSYLFREIRAERPEDRGEDRVLRR